MRLIHALLRAAAAAALLLVVPVQGFAQGAAADFELRRANVLRPAAGRALTPPSQAAHARIVGDFLRSRGASAATVQSLRETSAGKSRAGITHLRMEQQLGGFTVYGSYVKAAINQRGELVHLIERLAPVPSAAPADASIDVRQALAAAMARLHPGEQVTFLQTGRSGNVTTFARGTYFHADPSVERVVVPSNDGSMAIGFLVQTWTSKGNLLHHTLVSGAGRVLAVERRTANDSYNVFTIDPAKTAQSVVTGPTPGSSQPSPNGWLGDSRQSSINISGNNVIAYLDTDNNNRSDRGGTSVTSGNFLTAADLSVSPSTAANREVAVQNLFYLNNLVHDRLYTLGFDEAAGNFQNDNFRKGGKGRDPVQAEAQDGGGTDNANFATPPDGRKPRMQMYLWTGAGGTHEVYVNPGGPGYSAMDAAFGPALNTTGVTGDIQLVNDGTGTSTDACEPVGNAVSGKIALIDRGTCAFTVKVLNAQNAGAIGVIVANNVGTTEILPMGGTDSQITISAVLVSKNDGDLLKVGVSNVTIRRKAIQPLQRDASLDSDVVFHEYGHGLTWRMIGGMDGPLAGAIGEGASDVLAFLMNGDDRIGEYSSSNPNGIRRAPYSGYPLTYADVTGASVHNDGEIYAAAMWRLKELFEQNSIPIDTLFGYFVDGMNYTASTPSFEDMRNGMLQAASQNNSHCARIWEAFAQFGIGDGATGVVDSSGGVSITPSSTTRSDCTY